MESDTRAAATACQDCGLPPRECGCTAFREGLRQQADAFARAGHFALRNGRLHSGLRLLVQAIQLADPGDDGRAALGLAALAIGDTRLAREAWRGCGEDHDARRWLAALEEPDGPIHKALDAYDLALSHATAGRFAEALPLVQEVVGVLPGFVPAHRLHGLTLAALGEVAEAREAWIEGLEACSDDEPLLHYLARTAPAAAVIPAGTTSASTSALRGSWTTRRLSMAALWLVTIFGTWALASTLGHEHRSAPEGVDVFAAGASAPFMVASEAPTADSPAEPPPLPAPTAVSPLTLSGYRLGRLAAREGEWRAVVYHLESARSTDPDLYYVDDALYLLARAHAELGEPDTAREVARQILAEHPTSIFANSITHLLARYETP